MSRLRKSTRTTCSFLSASGNETKKPLADVSQLAMDDEPALTAAEQAYDAANFAGSIDGYRKAATSSRKTVGAPSVRRCG